MIRRNFTRISRSGFCQSMYWRNVNLCLFEELPKLLTGHPDQPTVPLVRVRVEYLDDQQQLSVGRFGNHFYERIANPSDILLFKKMSFKNADKSGVAFSEANMEELMQGTFFCAFIKEFCE